VIVSGRRVVSADGGSVALRRSDSAESPSVVVSVLVVVVVVVAADVVGRLVVVNDADFRPVVVIAVADVTVG